MLRPWSCFRTVHLQARSPLPYARPLQTRLAAHGRHAYATVSLPNVAGHIDVHGAAHSYQDVRLPALAPCLSHARVRALLRRGLGGHMVIQYWQDHASVCKESRFAAACCSKLIGTHLTVQVQVCDPDMYSQCTNPRLARAETCAVAPRDTSMTWLLVLHGFLEAEGTCCCYLHLAPVIRSRTLRLLRLTSASDPRSPDYNPRPSHH